MESLFLLSLMYCLLELSETSLCSCLLVTFTALVLLSIMYCLLVLFETTLWSCFVVTFPAWELLSIMNQLLVLGQRSASRNRFRIFIPVVVDASCPTILLITATFLQGLFIRVRKNFTCRLRTWWRMVENPHDRRLSTKYTCVSLGRS